MPCFVPDCGGHTAPGEDICAVHADAERAHVLQHEYERTQDLAEMYPDIAERAYRERARVIEFQRREILDRVNAAQWDGDGTPYGIAAMRSIMAELTRDAQHGRNNALNRAAFRLGRFVGGGELSHESTIADLREAGAMLRLPKYEVEHIIKGAYMRGVLNPKSAPERKAA